MPMHENIVSSLVELFQQNSWTRKELIGELFQNTELKEAYQSEIRRATIVGHIANQVLQAVWDAESCKVLAIGDIAYFDELDNEWQSLVTSSISQTQTQKLSGYDLSWLWSPELRSAITRYMSQYYDPELLPRNTSNLVIPSYGGTDSFVTILNTLKLIAKSKKVNFFYPEASFLANVHIAEMILGKDSLQIIQKPNKSDFFFSSGQIMQLGHSKDSMNIYYITPVGNPTGNKVESENMHQVMQQIHELDSGAIFILDTVYVGLLPNRESHKLFEKILSNTPLLERIIFTESLSKTLGTTGLRLGWSWTTNVEFSRELKKYTAITKAWYSKLLDQFTIQLLSNPNIFDFQNRVYEFWSRERLGFLSHMKSHFPELFDLDSSPSITDREGIYVLLKIQGSHTKEVIFAETGIIGVGITLSDGEYIRYAFGNVKEF
jgi:aspartate/methionine/tyrosine aminotransferase